MNEFDNCGDPVCWINTTVIPRRPEAVWPLVVSPERVKQYHLWSFYVRWSGKQTGHANRKYICERHHIQIFREWGQSTLEDMRVQEVTDQWLVRTNSRMTLS